MWNSQALKEQNAISKRFQNAVLKSERHESVGLKFETDLEEHP